MSTHLPGSAQEIAERALALSRADHTTVVVDELASADLRWACNGVTLLSSNQDRSVTVVSVVGRGEHAAAGVVTRRGAGPDELAELVAAADDAARRHPHARDATDPPAARRDGDWDLPPERAAPEVLDATIDGLSGAFRRGARDGLEHHGYASHRHTTTYLASSSGLRLRHAGAAGHLDAQLRSADGTMSSWAGTGTTDFGEVAVAALDDELRRRLHADLPLIEVPAGRHDTVLSPACVADLMLHLYWSAEVERAAAGGSPLGASGRPRLGERLAPAGLSLRSDPHDPVLRCAPFTVARESGAAGSVFDNGVPLAPTRWIDDGVLRALPGSRRAAGAAGVPATGPVDNLILDGPAASAAGPDPAAGIERGLLVTSLWYIRDVDPARLLVTGVSRDGVHVVEDGRVVGRAANLRFEESSLEVLARAVAVGPARRTVGREGGPSLPRTVMPSLRVPDFRWTATSDAV
ncbi:metallopeptidase TldD-related protein [Saccharothrix sp. BKS2]|uniref:metallopeptidase TldD-related protein n=1 Tax=Saccharothrix sp. BKS2 TaxID=3064400 RepID=UPI0039EB8AB9